MTHKQTIQSYINNFRRRLTPVLRPGIGLTCFVHSTDAGGAILEFKVGPQLENDDIYKDPVPTIGKALAGIEQHAFGGNVEGFIFRGTNYLLERGKIILIKEDDASEWSDAAAERDVQRILRQGPRTPR